MRESLKAIGILVFLILGVATLVVWLDDRPDNTTWILRLAFPAVAGLVIYMTTHIKPKPDIIPDFLSKYSPSYFDCRGFCFTFFPSRENDTFMLNMIFQNRYERRSVVKVAVRPGGLWFLGDKATAIFHIECGPGSFGMANQPMGIPAKFQGKKHMFFVGGKVSYPEGKGRMLRFHNAVRVTRNLRFRNKFMIVKAMLGLLSMHLLLEVPANITIQLPENVAELIHANSQQYTEIMWTLNDDYPSDFWIKGFPDQTRCSESA